MMILFAFFNRLHLLEVDRPARSNFNCERRRFDSIISLSHFFFDDLFYTYIEEEGFIRPVLPEYFGKRRQEFPKLLKRNGSFYFIKVASLIEFESFLSNRNGYKICTGSESAINIDTIEDLALARKLVNEFTESYIQN